jgi:hypothetical protein
MKPFTAIAIPHKDILEGRFSLDVYAADLMKVYKGEAPDEYQNPNVFFSRTYITTGTKNLFDVVKNRIDGKGGDPIIQLQTPFGGGKTHSLIALYHKAKEEWKSNLVIIDGTAYDPKEVTLWEEIERQLTKEITLLKGQTTPGKEKLTKLLENYQPLLILMDEILQYIIKAAGIKVGSTTLAEQHLAFFQELTGAISIIPNAALVFTLPSSEIEHYSEKGEEFFKKLQKIFGRVEKILTPVQDEEISEVIRKRLFSSIDQKAASDVIEEFLTYAEKEKILPEGLDLSQYRKMFNSSYPFQPEVIDVLYKNWGSFPTFQRTRGVLRILALVTHSLKNSKIPFIRLGDFDLTNEELRKELIKHIGQEYDSIIAADITSPNSGAKRVDNKARGTSYYSFSFGTKVATAIFLYSFSGGPKKGATEKEIKLACSDINFPSSIIVETINNLRESLFYISDSGLFFTNQPNLNRILLDKIESVKEKDIETEEKDLLNKVVSKNNKYFTIYIWPNNSKDLPDDKKLKLVILKDKTKCKEFLEYYGDKPRIYRNTLIFLCQSETERINFEQFVKRKIAWNEIKEDKRLHLSDEQKERVKDEVKKAESSAKGNIRNLYRILLIPSKTDFKEENLGMATYGIEKNIDEEVYEKLKSEGEILEKLSPIVLKDYLKDKDYIQTKNIYESFYKTPGEKRIVDENVLKNSIKEGVKKGEFGLGYIENGQIICKYFEIDSSPELIEDEIIIKKELCLQQKQISQQNSQYQKLDAPSTKIEKPQENYYQEDENHQEKYKDNKEIKINEKESEFISQIFLRLDASSLGKFYEIYNMIRSIKDKFQKFSLKIEILAKEGTISKSDYEDKIKETINQLKLKIEKEEIN